MPLIDEEEFYRICNDLDQLKEKQKDLEKGYIDLKLENTKIRKHKRYRNLIIIILITIIFLLFFYFRKRQIEFVFVNEKNIKLETRIDSIRNLKKEDDSLISDEKSLVFAVQIGVLKDFIIPEGNSKLIGRIRELPNGSSVNISKYIAGEFYTYEEAKIFRDEIKKTGIKDAFIIALHEGNKIHISKALELLDN